ncbi:M42 family metallopeptidase [Vaginisenegalia massiliensis]|uniref:M42 family metallopeptidase n=1 Tax=Vaginisenegalia massiliensis TaxID=2058294 RepID=UPI000F547AEB|nr:M42 family metallopeptidase [Vaginisenegalia massiliensis]
MNQISPKSFERLEAIKRLTEIPSPTGHTQAIIQYIAQDLASRGIAYQLTAKGGLMVSLTGQDDQRHRFVTAHVDTLGAMVRAIKADGRLKLDLIGGFTYHAIEGEYCTIHSSRLDKTFTGTILMHQTSVHVYADARTAERNQTNIEVRLDEHVETAEDTLALGIQVGDFISFDPRTQITPNGYIKSRHLDDKVSAALMLELIHKIHSQEMTLAHTTHFYFSNNEEIGYGANAGIPEQVEEYLAVDMGAMGDDQQTDEYSVSICVKDGSGPYHLGMRNYLVDLCEIHQIDYRLDIYPYYASDASGALRAGYDVRHGLFGAGIEASHAYERTHADSVDATYHLLKYYLASPMLTSETEEE